jgi:hypothetical protein
MRLLARILTVIVILAVMLAGVGCNQESVNDKAEKTAPVVSDDNNQAVNLVDNHQSEPNQDEVNSGSASTAGNSESPSSDFVVENGVLTHYTGGILIEGGPEWLDPDTIENKDITIPGDLSITAIGPMCFSYRYGITAVTIPNSVTVISESSFDALRRL